ncbi:cupin domain-containing protein [Haloarchaeobius sp. DT45]|uniref:cupin domain-containing protein n=1 Tax=Haloarchaeobius sp. DT45 TaxID=3446116 RepID=UPI003F6AED16
MTGYVNEAECEWETVENGETRFRRKRLGTAAGSDRLGASLYELPPGSRSWPYHYHTANEEAIYVLAGSGMLRTADGEESLDAGDFVAVPTGEDGAHRVVNSGDAPLRYLCVSTMRDPDVTVYPDSGKLGIFAGAPPGGDSTERTVGGYYPRDAAVDYWDGEER